MLLGTLIILGAFWLRGQGDAFEDNSIVVAPAPERDAITTRDSDGDGVEDWAEALEAGAFRAITPSTSTPPNGNDEPYEPPTTLTGKFSEAFLQDYLEGKMRGADFSDPTALVGSAVSAIESSTKAKRYTRLDVLQVPDASDSAYEYGNRLGQIVLKHSVGGENEASILERALTANDPEVLTALAPIETAYTNIIRDMLLLPVPRSFTDEHVALLNALEAVRTDVSAMEEAFTDPLLALARMREYPDDAAAQQRAFEALARTLVTAGAEYGNAEPGALFYLFES